jgi:hypothetical protein
MRTSSSGASSNARIVQPCRASTSREEQQALLLQLVLVYRLSYRWCYSCPMSETITFRPDEDAKRALAALTADGTPVSTAVRSALIETARSRAQQRLRAEAAELAADESDRAEVAQVLRDMETLRAW